MLPRALSAALAEAGSARASSATTSRVRRTREARAATLPDARTLTRVNLGRFGIWLRHQDGTAEAQPIEDLGFGAIWIGGSPSLDEARPFLELTHAVPVVTGILNVWRHEPAAVAAGHARLRADFGDRFLLGVGIGHPEATSDYKRPLTTMRN